MKVRSWTVLLAAVAIAACTEGGGGGDASLDAAAEAAAEVKAEVGAEAGQETVAPEGAEDAAAPDDATAEATEATEPDASLDALPETSADAQADSPADAFTVSCCMYDWQCGPGRRCVPVQGGMGACKPEQTEGACWTGQDCGPDKVCVGAVPCPCDWQGEGDGCDIPGQCVDEAPGCCDSDLDCPAHEVCGPLGTCVPEPTGSECWTDSDCFPMQACTGASTCPCGAVCGAITHPGTCSPLPAGCCHSDADCSKSEVCRAVSPDLPGRCVPWPGGPACQDGECCWEDVDCLGGTCEGAHSCGCIELCPACGACAADEMGHCVPYGILVTLEATEAGCSHDPGGHPAFTQYRVHVKWHTSIPAKTNIVMALNEFSGANGYIPSYEFVQDGEVDVSFTHMHFGEVPKAGDRLLLRAVSEGEGGEKGASEDLVIEVDEAIAACLYPYDKECSDGGPILCRAVPPPCDEDKVMASIDGCQRCVYPATCSCDDGSTPICLSVPPVCKEHEVLAVQNGCHECVSPYTCKPPVPGDPW